MEKEQKLKEVAKLLFTTIIKLQRECNNIAQAIQESGDRNNMEIIIQTGDFIPLIKFAETLEIPSDKESIMYDEIDDMIENQENMDSKVENFFEKYI